MTSIPMSWNRASMAVAAGLALCGCGTTTGQTWTTNPARSGVEAMDPARIGHESYEAERGLQAESLDHVARVTDFDADTICFDVALRGLTSDDGDLVTRLDNFEPELRVDDAALPLTHAALEEPAYEDQRGGVQRLQKTRRVRHCPALNRDGWTACGHHRTTYERVARSSQLTVVTGGGVLCAQHGGRVTTDTGKIELRLRPRHEPRRCRARSSRRQPNPCDGELVFRWRFE